MRYSFINYFDQSDLKTRILFMSPGANGWRGWWRYALVAALAGVVVLACQKGEETPATNKSDKPLTQMFRSVMIPETNPSRRLVNQFQEKSYDNYQSLYRTSNRYVFHYVSWRTVLMLEKGHLAFRKDFTGPVTVYINGEKATRERATRVAADELDEFFVLGNPSEGGTVVLIQTQAPSVIAALVREPGLRSSRSRHLRYLEALSQTTDPSGNSYTYDMNDLLEATFFKRKEPLVERLPNQQLRVMDEFRKDIEVYIDGEKSTPEFIDTLHVRQIKKLYSRERPVEEWSGLQQEYRSSPGPLSRYILYVETAPNRIRRDSTYYVFSPFYSGDF